MDESSDRTTSTLDRLRLAWRAARLWLILILGLLGCIAAISLPASGRETTFGLSSGDVSPQDILAPYSLSYISETLTEGARLTAGEGVPNIYALPDGKVVRQQVDRLKSALNFIDTVRNDEFSTTEEKIADLAALQDVYLDPEMAQAILELSDEEWEALKLETLSVLEQVMRNEIRDGRLDEARRTIPAFISISFPADQSESVSYLASAFVAPNTFPDEEATAAAIETAREAVDPITKSYSAGETILRRGEVVNALHLEALEEFGLLKPPEPWQELAVNSLLIILLGSVFTLYAYRIHPDQITDVKLAATVSVLLVLNTAGMQLMIPGRTVLPYIFPGAALPVLLTVLFNPGMGIVTALVTGALGGFLSPRGLELALYIMLGASLAVLVIRKAERLGSFVWAGAVAALGATVVIIIFRVPDPTTDILGKASLLGAGVISGFLSASLAFVLLLIVGSILRITTNLQLIELSRPDHPLLQQVLHTAPGTYQHSLQVANLTEQAARAIGANVLLVRVGSLYHDAGKSMRPQFFIENQIPGQNIHEQLDPATSAQVIISHVSDGLDLARKYRLPKPIQAFISEHHGTMMTRYQYRNAVDAAGGDETLVNKSDFTYPGPRPRSRETALLMLADGVEARARAETPQNKEELDQLVRSVIENRIAQGQLDRTDLTLKDLDTVREVYVKALRNIYHPRIKYPEAKGDPPPDKPQRIEPAPTVPA